MNLFVIFAVIVLLLAANALYVAAEFAAVSARRTRIQERAAEGNRVAKSLLSVLESREELDRYIAACQIGITLSSLVIGFYGQAQLGPYLSPLFVRFGGLQEAAAYSVSAVVVLLLLTTFQVILGELMPKSVAVRYPERLALVTTPPMRVSLWILRPFIWVLNGSALALLKSFGAETSLEGEHVHSPEELERLVKESAQGGLIDAGEREMLENVLRIETLVARQIMVPRTRIVTASIEDTPADLLAKLVDSPHMRFPAVEGNVDNIVGMIHLRDLFAFAQDNPAGSLKEIVRELPLYPESITVSDLWDALRLEGRYMAALFDEHGGTAGLVTLEDIVEEVVGELQDEFDQETEAVRYADDGRVYLRGDLLVSAVNNRLLLNLPTGEADTVGGLVVEQLEHVPRQGEEVRVGGVSLRAEQVEARAVTEVSLATPTETDPLAEQDGQADVKVVEGPSAEPADETTEQKVQT